MLLFSLLSLTALASATVLPHAVSPYNPQGCISSVTENGGVYFCNGYNYMGDCDWRAYLDTEDWCYSFANLYERPRSIAPDQDGYCELFNKEGCRGEAVGIWEGVSNKKLECPGMSDSGKPEWWVSMRCQLKVV